MVTAATAGLLAGLVHALAGPDHLAAVAPLAVERRPGGRSWWGSGIGLLWGAGHSCGVWGVGLLALALKDLLPLEQLSSWSERLVGVVLVAVGVWGLGRAVRRRGSSGGHGHSHPSYPESAAGSRPRLAAFGIGALHGFAGSSHVLGLLPALALPSQAAALAYVIAFGLGTVAAMAAFSTLLSGVAGRLTRFGPGAYPALLASLSGAAIVVGGFWLLAVGRNGPAPAIC